VGYVTKTPYTWLAVAMTVALAIERYVQPRPLQTALAENPGYRGALAGIIAGSVVALVTEDSGVVMPALMLLAGGLSALYLASSPLRVSNGGPMSPEDSDASNGT